MIITNSYFFQEINQYCRNCNRNIKVFKRQLLIILFVSSQIQQISKPSKINWLLLILCDLINIILTYIKISDLTSLIILMSQNQPSKVIKEEVIFTGKWLGMKYVDYTIGDKVVHNYQKIFRVTEKDRVSSVDIIPIIKYKEGPSELIMNVQFRAPVHGYTLQFPTGMTEDDNYQQNAKRQLLEETGYVIESIVKIPTPVLSYDPWKSNEDTYMFVATINGDDPNSYKGQQLEHDQDIKIVKFRIDQHLLEKIVDYCKEHKLHLQAKVYSFCLGLWLKNSIGKI